MFQENMVEIMFFFSILTLFWDNNWKAMSNLEVSEFICLLHLIVFDFLLNHHNYITLNMLGEVVSLWISEE